MAANRRPRAGRFEPAEGQAGTSLLETLAVLTIAGILVAITVPSIVHTYRGHQVASAAASIQGMVRHARFKALEKKVDHRLVFHDEGANNANRVDVEEDQGGGFVTLTSLAYRLPQGVRILGSGSTNSADQVYVTRRGHCESGSVYIGGPDGATRVVSIKTSCFASLE